MKTILVTGGCGFIGSHTCLSLLKNFYNLIVIDSLVNSSPISLERVKIILSKENIKNPKILYKKGDIRNEKFLENIFSEAFQEGSKIDAVIHFAGLKAVEESVNNPILYWDANVSGSICLLKVMEKYQCKTLVFSSSATVYGKPKSVPITENEPIRPYNPYGQTKASIESLIESIFYSEKVSSWKIANLRYFNPIGAHESGLIGEDPNNKPNNLFPIICKVALRKYRNLSIYGKDWPTHDGTGVRDYIHVMDLADSHRIALEHLFKEDPQILNLNIGTGIGTSVLELVETFKMVNKCHIPYQYCDRRSGDVANVIADNKKAIETLDWEPKKNIEDMCRDGWKWQKDNMNGYRS